MGKLTDNYNFARKIWLKKKKDGIGKGFWQEP